MVKGLKKGRTADPLGDLKRIMSHYRPAPLKGLPRFYGGAVGFLSYDTVRFVEKIPDRNKDDLNLPDALFLITDNLLIFDHVAHTIKVVSCVHLERGKGAVKSYRQACHKIDYLISNLRRNLRPKAIPVRKKNARYKPKSNFSEEEFSRIVRKTKEYIKRGDIIQAVLSQRFELPVSARPFDIYRTLRVINPSPYMYFLRLGNFYLVGSSPEILVRKEGRSVELRPIAGTRPRAEQEHMDQVMARDLLRDPKERAEHIMLVDLGRNDLGRVSEYGSVHVPELMVIEKYSHVMHIVSEVKGRLKRGLTSFEVLKACFPAGTVSGAPKIRAMEIIDELENVRRGPYAGAVGYFSFQGNMDMAITIRTILILNRRAYIQAGAGIVKDSKPEREYQETLNKARAMLSAIEMAERGVE